MKRKTRKTLSLSTAHAAHALHTLLADGKLTLKDVTNALKRREAMIRDLRERLAALEAGEVSKIAGAARRVARKAKRKTKRKMSAVRRAALQLHGKYLGTVGTLSKESRAKVKAIREKSGVRAAIAAARKMGR